jgi:hypothetical protein
MRTGTANLPLHYGRAPRWLFGRMTRLAGEIASVVVEEHGTEEMLRRLADPFWFQSIATLEQALRRARVGDREKLLALRRLASWGQRTRPKP